MASNKTAAERHAAAKAEVKRVERRIDVANEHRRQVLRQGEANSTAAIRADDAIAELKLLRLRLIDQVELLGPAVAQEQQKQKQDAWPTSLPAALADDAATGAALASCESVPKLERSAAFDQEIDRLRQRQWAVRALIARLQPTQETTAA